MNVSQIRELIIKIPLYLAFGFLFSLNSIILFYHFSVIFGFIPMSLIYGGRIKNVEEMYLYESISIIGNLIILGIIYLKKRMFLNNKDNKIVNFLIFTLCFVFMLISIVNLISFNIVEVLIAVPYTFISVVLCWRLNLPDDGSLIIKQEFEMNINNK